MPIRIALLRSVAVNGRRVKGFGLKSLGAVGTNRNWNTARKITAALDEMESA